MGESEESPIQTKFEHEGDDDNEAIKNKDNDNEKDRTTKIDKTESVLPDTGSIKKIGEVKSADNQVTAVEFTSVGAENESSQKETGGEDSLELTTNKITVEEKFSESSVIATESSYKESKEGTADEKGGPLESDIQNITNVIKDAESSIADGNTEIKSEKDQDMKEDEKESEESPI